MCFGVVLHFCVVPYRNQINTSN